MKTEVDYLRDLGLYFEVSEVLRRHFREFNDHERKMRRAKYDFGRFQFYSEERMAYEHVAREQARARNNPEALVKINSQLRNRMLNKMYLYLQSMVSYNRLVDHRAHFIESSKQVIDAYKERKIGCSSFEKSLIELSLTLSDELIRTPTELLEPKLEHREMTHLESALKFAYDEMIVRVKYMPQWLVRVPSNLHQTNVFDDTVEIRSIEFLRYRTFIDRLDNPRIFSICSGLESKLKLLEHICNHSRIFEIDEQQVMQIACSEVTGLDYSKKEVETAWRNGLMHSWREVLIRRVGEQIEDSIVSLVNALPGAEKEIRSLSEDFGLPDTCERLIAMNNYLAAGLLVRKGSKIIQTNDFPNRENDVDFLSQEFDSVLEAYEKDHFQQNQS